MTTIKIKKEKPLSFEQLYEKIENFVKENHENYGLIGCSEAGRYFMLVKKMPLTVTYRNENSVFMPYETNTLKNFLVFFIIHYGKKDSPFVKSIFKLDGRVFFASEQQSIEEIVRDL